MQQVHQSYLKVIYTRFVEMASNLLFFLMWFLKVKKMWLKIKDNGLVIFTYYIKNKNKVSELVGKSLTFL